MTVTDANGVARFQVGGSTPTVVRDAAGNAVYEDDATAGWGLRSPVVPVPLYQTNVSGNGFVTWSGVDFGELVMYTGQIYVDHPRLNFQYQLYLDSNGTNTATASARMTYNGSTISGSTTSQSTTSSAAPVVTGSILLSEADFGTLQTIQLLQHQTAGGPSGSADCFAVPRYVVLLGE